MSLPALTRGLTLLEELIKQPFGLRYSDLKGALSGVGDASLNRLLSSLADSGHLNKKDGLYYPAERVKNWSLDRAGSKDFEEKIKDVVESLVQRTGESAGFCLYQNKRLVIQHSISYPDSINIIGSGNTLHYEWDHAASLAVMDLLTDGEREEAIKSANSRTTDSEWRMGKELFSKGTYYTDLSRLREGISRMALPWVNKAERGALFLCLPTIRLTKRERPLLEIMKEELSRLAE